MTPTFAAADRLHVRPVPLPIPGWALFHLQSAHGKALRYERLAHDAGDRVAEAKAHGLVLRIASLLWPVGGAA